MSFRSNIESGDQADASRKKAMKKLESEVKARQVEVKDLLLKRASLDQNEIQERKEIDARVIALVKEHAKSRSPQYLETLAASVRQEEQDHQFAVDLQGEMDRQADAEYQAEVARREMVEKQGVKRAEAPRFESAAKTVSLAEVEARRRALVAQQLEIDKTFKEQYERLRSQGFPGFQVPGRILREGSGGTRQTFFHAPAFQNPQHRSDANPSFTRSRFGSSLNKR
jgi:hypothetical protein